MANTETKTFYKGEVEITFYPDSHRYKLAGERSYLTSVTAITGIIDKSRVLIPWAVGLTGAFLRKYLEEAAANNFTKEELYSVIDEALVQHTVKKEAAADIGSRTHDLAQKIGEALRDNKSLEIEALQNLNDKLEELNKKKEFFSSDNAPLTEEEEKELDILTKVSNGVQAFINWVVDHNVKFLECERMVYSRKHKFVGITDAIIELNGKKYLIDYKTSKGVYNEMKYQLAGYTIAYEEETGEKLDGQMIIHFNKETGECKVHEISNKDNNLNKKTFLHLVAVKNREKELSK